MTKGKFVRLKWGTWVKLRKIFPAVYAESASSYFQRLADWLGVEHERDFLEAKHG